MEAYVYQSALLCEGCAGDIRHDLGRVDDFGGDSDLRPQGPFENGGGEADGPQHCDICGLFLENPLTRDGVEYVRDVLARPGVTFGPLERWRGFYSHLLR